MVEVEGFVVDVDEDKGNVDDKVDDDEVDCGDVLIGAVVVVLDVVDVVDVGMTTDDIAIVVEVNVGSTLVD